MAALTHDIQRPYRGADPARILEVPVAGATAMSGAHTIYARQPVCSDVSVAAGYAHGVGAGATYASGDVFFGMSLDHVVVGATETADGTHKVSVYRDGTWQFPLNSLTQADVGKNVYITSDTVITVTSTNALWIGVLAQVDDFAWVDIETAANRTTAAA